MNTRIKYTNRPYEEIYTLFYVESRKGTYVSYIRGTRCNDEESFFREISASFQFPNYFGENWNALDDCICDLEWLCFNKIMIVIDDYNMAFEGDKQLQQLLERHLESMVAYWDEQSVPVEVWLNIPK